MTTYLAVDLAADDVTNETDGVLAADDVTYETDGRSVGLTGLGDPAPTSATYATKSVANERRIWLIGGTQESSQLAIALFQSHIPCTISVTTPAAESLYPKASMLRVWVGKMNASQVESFLQEEGIEAILDASHPYAVEISRLAIAASTQHQIPYLRYERPIVQGGGGASERGSLGAGDKSDRAHTIDNTVIQPESFETLIAGDYLAGQRVLLTVGYRPLPLFRGWLDRSTIFARILPSVTALEAAIAAGFTPDRLIAIRPPVGIELERALWEHWQISMVVTKASGSPGGEDVKRQLAAELGVSLVIIDRPPIDYPQQTSDLSTALAFCQQHIFS